jgi:hypothetical protein
MRKPWHNTAKIIRRMCRMKRNFAKEAEREKVAKKNIEDSARLALSMRPMPLDFDDDAWVDYHFSSDKQ